ncbi:cytochrome P450 [Nocardia abscessus]|uniref:cytochrome P450 n=1 Tax=Nocardia abscessus TaxID=120957 RepID=UPI0018961440|nr:cytochrome P450 [Nocardia abscessus]MBF6341125.1 cytochrome P450 [Nocardia abscessus]
MNDISAEAVAGTLGKLLDPANRHDPYPLYASIQQSGPAWLEPLSAFVVAGFSDCEALLRDPRLSAEREGDDRKRWEQLLAPDVPSSVLQPWFLSLDPPDHTRLRRLVAKSFTARSVARLESYVFELADNLLDAVAERGTTSMDVVAELARPLPTTVICHMLGVPLADEPLFRGWSDRLIVLVDGFDMEPPPADRLPDWLSALTELHRYIDDLITTRRRSSGDDLISDLLAAEEEGDVLGHDELISTVVLLLVAGHETTVNLIANGILAVLRQPELLNDLRERPELAPAVVEETLRHDPPVQLTARLLKEDTELCGHTVPRGAMVNLLLAAAQRDPAVFIEPNLFDPGRPDSRHLAFGSGPHFCLGAPLARLEGAAAFQRFAERVVNPILVQDPPPYRPHVNLRGPEALVVRFTKILPRLATRGY